MGASIWLVFFAPVIALYAVLSMISPALAENVMDMLMASFYKFMDTPLAEKLMNDFLESLIKFVEFLNNLP